MDTLEKYESLVEKSGKVFNDQPLIIPQTGNDIKLCSFNDLMMERLLRINQINNNQKSDYDEANLMDMTSFAIFALIKLESAAL